MSKKKWLASALLLLFIISTYILVLTQIPSATTTNTPIPIPSATTTNTPIPIPSATTTNTPIPTNNPEEIDEPETPETYLITYQLNGGTNAANNPNAYNAYSVFPINIFEPFLTGYKFEVWGAIYADGSFGELPASGIPAGTTGDITLVAVWDAVPVRYTITYLLDGGVNAPGNPDYYTVTDPFPFTIENPSKPSYIFTGWTASYSNGTQSEPTTTYVIHDGMIDNIVLTATWEVSTNPLQHTRSVPVLADSIIVEQSSRVLEKKLSDLSFPLTVYTPNFSLNQAISQTKTHLNTQQEGQQ